MKQPKLVTTGLCGPAHATSAPQETWGNAPSTHQISTLQPAMDEYWKLRQKAALSPVTEPNLSLSESSTPPWTSDWCSPLTTGQQNSSEKDTQTGQSETGLFATSEKQSPKLGLPTDPQARKKVPLWSGLVKYFPDALAAVAAVSYQGNEQHNPGKPLHWDRSKSMDQQDTLLRHLWESGTIDTDGHLHSAKVAWRALAMLQLELENNAN